MVYHREKGRGLCPFMGMHFYRALAGTISPPWPLVVRSRTNEPSPKARTVLTDLPTVMVSDLRESGALLARPLAGVIIPDTRCDEHLGRTHQTHCILLAVASGAFLGLTAPSQRLPLEPLCPVVTFHVLGRRLIHRCPSMNAANPTPPSDPDTNIPSL